MTSTDCRVMGLCNWILWRRTCRMCKNSSQFSTLFLGKFWVYRLNLPTENIRVVLKTIKERTQLSRVVLWDTVAKIVAIFSEFCETQTFIAVFTQDGHWSLSWARWILSAPFHSPFKISVSVIPRYQVFQAALDEVWHHKDITLKELMWFLIS
jgi:hypothetical protein